MLESKKTILCQMGLITLLILLVYGNTITHDFIWDDHDIIIENPLLQKPGNLLHFFLTEDRIEAATGYYRPITYISFALERMAWGLNPVGYNITNLLLHLLVALTLYQVVALLFSIRGHALTAALIFSLHPITVETVNFHAGGRNTLLSALFALLSLLMYLKQKRLAAIACFTLAIFSKEFALLLPLVFLFVDVKILREKIRPGRYLPYLIVIIGYLTIRSYAVQHANFLTAFNLLETLQMTPYLIVRYLLNMFFPFQLKLLYDTHTTLTAVMACLGTVAGTGYGVYLLRKQNDLLFSFGWFFIFLLPVINIIPIPSSALMADRYAYFSLMGFAIGVSALLSRWQGRSGTICTVIVCALFAFTDIQTNNFWKNDEVFFTRMIKDAPEMASGYQNLGIHFFKKGDYSLAEKYLTLAGTKPDLPTRNLGVNAGIFMQANKFDAAEALLLKQLQKDPANPQSYAMLTRVYEQKGDKIQAKSYNDKAEKMFPGMKAMMEKRAVEACRQGEQHLALKNYALAENLFTEALTINPGFIPAMVDMGSLYAERGDITKALRYFKNALERDPDHAAAHYNLSQVYQMQGKEAEAQEELKKFDILQRNAGQSTPTATSSPQSR